MAAARDHTRPTGWRHNPGTAPHPPPATASLSHLILRCPRSARAAPPHQLHRVGDVARRSQPFAAHIAPRHARRAPIHVHLHLRGRAGQALNQRHA